MTKFSTSELQSRNPGTKNAQRLTALSEPVAKHMREFTVTHFMQTVKSM